MLKAKYHIRESNHILYLDSFHLKELTFPLVIVMPDEMVTKRKWWQFWEPEWIEKEALSFYDNQTRVAHLTQTDYGIAVLLTAARNKDTSNGS